LVYFQLPIYIVDLQINLMISYKKLNKEFFLLIIHVLIKTLSIV
jgi:hypothetical protein